MISSQSEFIQQQDELPFSAARLLDDKLRTAVLRLVFGRVVGIYRLRRTKSSGSKPTRIESELRLTYILDRPGTVLGSNIF